MRLNKTIEEFYLSILDYAGLKLDEDENICAKSDKIGKITLDDKPIALPYFDSLKNPNGKAFFHPLNESYTSPETSMFSLYKRKLTLEINLRLTSLITSLIVIASDPKMQQKIKSSALLDIVTNLGEADHSMVEVFLKMISLSQKENEEGFVVDFFLKKNGMIDDTPYAAIGKVNFKLFNEITKGLAEGSGNYAVYGTKVRKKDLLTLNNIFMTLFPGIEDSSVYVDGTDNKIFRYLNMLLRITYMVSSRINEVGKLLGELKDETLHVEDIVLDETWTDHLESLCGMSAEIRLIPNQTDNRTEAKRLQIDESKARVEQVTAPVPVQQPHPHSPPQYQPPQQVAPQQQFQPQQQIQQTQQTLSPEEIIRGRMNQQPQYQPQQQQMQPMYGNPMMQPQAPIPSWMQQEMMQGQMQQPVQQQFQQPQFQQQMPQYGQMVYQQQQPMGFQQPMGNMPFNPQFGQAKAPWN